MAERLADGIILHQPLQNPQDCSLAFVQVLYAEDLAIFACCEESGRLCKPLLRWRKQRACNMTPLKLLGSPWLDRADGAVSLLKGNLLTLGSRAQIFDEARAHEINFIHFNFKKDCLPRAFGWGDECLHGTRCTRDSIQASWIQQERSDGYRVCI